MPVEPELTSVIQELLPGATIEAQQLPGCSQIRLYLLNPDYPQHTLSGEQFNRLLNEPMYWVFCWASGQVLANYILQNPAIVKNKRVLDFGCGSGVVAIACAMAGAQEVIASDIDPLARQATQANLQLNGVQCQVTGDWNGIDESFDVIVVADVLYDKQNLDFLPQFLQRASEVLVADSRVKDFNQPPYKLVCELESSTWPDLDEANEFRNVRIYSAVKN